VSRSPFAGLEPKLVWARFAELTRIPRPPKQEAAVREHVLAWADARGLSAQTDATGNVVVRVPASAGREGAPVVVLQAHLDMVCERNPGSPFDARAGRIDVVRDGDWLRAEGTTLGADNGIGVAAALAAAEDPHVAHGPLELLLTVSEEHGLEGAKGLDPALVSGRLLLNLDGTSDGTLTIGCAGSAHTLVRLPLRPDPLPPGHVALEVAVTGGRGGHSGGDIARGRANAIKALGRILREGREAAPLRLAALEGGASRNAIPREAAASVAVPAVAEAGFRAATERELTEIRAQHPGEDRLELRVRAAGSLAGAATEQETARALDLLAALPSSVVTLAPEPSGAVETSTCLTVARTEEGTLALASMTRSASPAGLEDTVASLEAIARLAGAGVETVHSYPPWQPDPASPLLAAASATYERLFGRPPATEVVHGGLECAVLGAKLPGLRMLALGPEIVGPHAPGERLSISSTARFYRLLCALLDDLSR
jgi:dipeptidase D